MFPVGQPVSQSLNPSVRLLLIASVDQLEYWSPKVPLFINWHGDRVRRVVFLIQKLDFF